MSIDDVVPEMIVSIDAGNDGQEACDWASMLLRMYNLWAERNGLTFTLVSFVEGELGGHRTAKFNVQGPGCERMGREVGVHRLVRRSPFDPAGRRHTSFAMVGHVDDAPDEPIRSYVLDPYMMVKDHRSGAERDDVETVLNGDLDGV